MKATPYIEAYNAGNEILPDYAYDRMGINEFDDSIGVGELVPHKYPMLSLSTEFCNMETITNKEIHEHGVSRQKTYVISAKADGVAVSLQANNGKYRLVSRGRRVSGYVLHPAFLKCMAPLKKQLPDSIELRGELMLNYKDFEEFNKIFDNRYSNLRSIVSAMTCANNPDERVVDKMFILWHGIQGLSRKTCHPIELLQFVDEQNIVPFKNVSIKSLSIAVRKMYNGLQYLDYPCDGVVIEHSLENLNDGRFHLDRVAFKQFDEAKYSGTTNVANIEWRLGHDGHYFPRLHFEPVEINGSTVSYAAGYCYDYLIRMSISIGSEVVVTMHGGVIPYVSTVNTAGSGNLNIPEDAITIKKGDIDIWSRNSETTVKRLRFQRGMGKLNKDFSPSLCSELFDSGIEDVFELSHLIRSINFESSKLIDYLNKEGGFPATEPRSIFASKLINCFKSINYQSIIESLLISRIGPKTSFVIGLKLSGFHTKPDIEKGVCKSAMAKILDDKKLCGKIKAYSLPINIEIAKGTFEYDSHYASENIKLTIEP